LRLIDGTELRGWDSGLLVAHRLPSSALRNVQLQRSWRRIVTALNSSMAHAHLSWWMVAGAP